MMCFVTSHLLCVVMSLGHRSSPFGLSNYDGIAEELSSTASTGGLSHAGPPGGLPIGPPTMLSAGPPTSHGGPSVQWKSGAVIQPASSVAVSRGQESTLHVSRLTANMQVSN